MISDANGVDGFCWWLFPFALPMVGDGCFEKNEWMAWRWIFWDVVLIGPMTCFLVEYYAVQFSASVHSFLNPSALCRSFANRYISHSCHTIFAFAFFWAHRAEWGGQGIMLHATLDSLLGCHHTLGHQKKRSFISWMHDTKSQKDNRSDE